MTCLRKMVALLMVVSLPATPVLATGLPQQMSRGDVPVFARLAEAASAGDRTPSPAEPLAGKTSAAKRDAVVEAIEKRLQKLRDDARTDAELRGDMIAAFRQHVEGLGAALGRQVQKGMSDAETRALLGVAAAHPRYEDYVLGMSEDREVVLACLAHDLRLMQARVTRAWRLYTREDFVRDLERRKQQIESLDYDAGDYDEFFEATYAMLHANNAFVWLLLPFGVGFDILMIIPVAIFKFIHWLFEY